MKLAERKKAKARLLRARQRPDVETTEEFGHVIADQFLRHVQGWLNEEKAMTGKPQTWAALEKNMSAMVTRELEEWMND